MITFKQDDSSDWYVPECHCKPGAGHICYARPMPVTAKLNINALKTTSGTALSVKNKEENKKDTP